MSAVLIIFAVLLIPSAFVAMGIACYAGFVSDKAKVI